ncbi:MAG: BrnA antitoxin family protein [Marinilabiliales bacterium]|nr:BrnA antitoxin family protein [Marinilabiliales bacterium]
MKKFYDFSKGKRGAVVPLPPGKTRITIRLDNEIIDWFRDKVETRGGGSYQTMINNVLRDYIQRGSEDFESQLRKIVREELKNGREERPGILHAGRRTSSS